MKIFLLIFLMSLTLSCSTRNISYNRGKIIDKYASKHEIYIDSKEVEFKNYYLDKDNIKNVTLSKKSKCLQINQINKTELYELKKVGLDSLNYGNKRRIGLAIIDAVPIGKEDLQKIKIDPNSIRLIKFIPQGKANEIPWLYIPDGGILLISTKQD